MRSKRHGDVPLEKIVESVLEDRSVSRDEDSLLVFYVVLDLGFYPLTMSLRDYLKNIKEGKIPSWDSITRIRRKLQENRVDLRGKTWDLRQRRAIGFIESSRQGNLDIIDQ
jgi:hypothetical protein